MPKDEKQDVAEQPEETVEADEAPSKDEIRAERKEAELKAAADHAKELRKLTKETYAELLAAAYEMATVDMNNATRSRISGVQSRLRDELKRAFTKLFV